MVRALVPGLLCWIFSLYVCNAAYSQTGPGERLMPSCGPGDVKFEVHPSKKDPEHEPSADKAVLYVLESFTKPIFEMRDVTMRVGVDGRWVGAVRMNYFIRVVLPAGEHHLCVQWQSAFKTYTQKGAFAEFDSSANQQYYFRIRLLYPGGLQLEPLNSDEAQFLFSHHKYRLAVSRARNHSHGSGPSWR
jgi:hypothetical protein